MAGNHLSQTLARAGIGVLRFDFTGLGNSQGEFAATTFSHNIEDLVVAARYLEATHVPPRLLVGHSLGGTAALHAASRLQDVRAVATIAAPAHAEHVTRLLRSSLAEIETTGEAEVDLGGGRMFRIRREFLEDLRPQPTLDLVRNSRAALLVLHSPLDITVDVTNAAEIWPRAAGEARTIRAGTVLRGAL